MTHTSSYYTFWAQEEETYEKFLERENFRRYMNPDAARLDAKDAEILLERWTRRKDREAKGPQVGDYVIFDDLHESRIAHICDWHDGSPVLFQPGFGSFHLSDNHTSYSGGLDPGIPIDRLVRTGDTRMGGFWFEHRAYLTGGCGVNVRLPVPLWLYKED